jgi:hypothetical protein
MKRLWSWSAGFGMFWYHFIVGDDWTVAAAVAAGLIATALLRLTTFPAWWLMPVMVVAILGISVRRFNQRSR